MLENDTRSIEYRIRRPDGSYFWVHDRQKVVRAENGEALEIAGSWTDTLIEWWNGPMIKATHPEQIEMLAPASPQG
jgi:hypothetical protein